MYQNDYDGYLEVTERVVDGVGCNLVAYATDFEIAQNSNRVQYFDSISHRILSYPIVFELEKVNPLKG